MIPKWLLEILLFSILIIAVHLIAWILALPTYKVYGPVLSGLFIKLLMDKELK